MRSKRSSDADGDVPGTVDQTWIGLDMALRVGVRGLLGGSSLPRLLAERRGSRIPEPFGYWGDIVE